MSREKTPNVHRWWGTVVARCEVVTRDDDWPDSECQAEPAPLNRQQRRNQKRAARKRGR